MSFRSLNYRKLKFKVLDKSQNNNQDYFNKVRKILIDPQARQISEDVKWVNLDDKWGIEKFPVVMAGDGDPILLIHGFDSCFLEFRRIYPFLKKHFSIIIPDLLGFGFSPRKSESSYTPENILSSLEDLIIKLSLKKKIKIVGASMGASVALSLSNRIEKNIEKILLLSPAGIFEEPKSIPWPLNQIGASFLSLPLVRKNLCKQAFAYPEKSVGTKEEQIASIHLGCSGWRNSLASFAKSGGFGGSYRCIRDIPIKTICGKNDRILGEKELNKLKSFNKLNSVILNNCGHLPHLDLKDLTAKIIFDYFKK